MTCPSGKQCSIGAAPYCVQHDDTFYKISRCYNISLDDLLEANPDTDPERLTTGETLCIPLAAQTVTCPPDAEIYVIQKGDTLYKLSQKFNIKISMLFKANYRINPDALLPGQKICVPHPWNKYTNPDYNIEFLYPTRWARVNNLRYEGIDGFFHLSALQSEKSLEELSREEAHHRLKPYGSQPKITISPTAGLKSSLVFPSSDQPTEMRKQAALIMQYPWPIEVNCSKHNHLILWADHEHMEDIKNSIQIME